MNGYDITSFEQKTLAALYRLSGMDQVGFSSRSIADEIASVHGDAPDEIDSIFNNLVSLGLLDVVYAKSRPEIACYKLTDECLLSGLFS